MSSSSSSQDEEGGGPTTSRRSLFVGRLFGQERFSLRSCTSIDQVPQNPECATTFNSPAYSRLDSGKFARDFGLHLGEWRAGLREVMAEIAEAQQG